MAVTLNSSTSAGLVITSDTTGSMSLQSSGTTKIAITSTGAAIAGTNTNDSAAAGYVGEYIESVVSATNAPATGVYGDLASISLTAGDWDVTMLATLLDNGATLSGLLIIGITTTSGNSSTGMVFGSNAFVFVEDAGGQNNGVIPAYRVSLSSTTTYYAKFFAQYSAGTAQMRGRLSARRVR